jgi:hypothetical protein
MVLIDLPQELSYASLGLEFHESSTLDESAGRHLVFCKKVSRVT